MKNIKSKIKQTLNDEGIKGLIKKTIKYINYNIHKKNRLYDAGFKDVLFINGCSLPHPQRYRVTHQIEQLEAYGISCDKVDYDKLDMSYLKYYRAFVFYRCPILPIIEEFIKEAKNNNKTIFYDIDDLVFDLEHTKKIKFLDTMTKEERDLYDNGVIRMGKTLDLCEYGIASTERLQIEMGKHLKEVYVNRNTASDEMVLYSKKALENVKKDPSKIFIGYLSGTITHNDDFKLIMNSIIKVLKKYDNVYLKIVGLLELPKEMECVRNKIVAAKFVDYKELPNLIRSVDINLAPLEDTIFNEAKSENKWTEAALVKIPTIASNVGAFKHEIKNGETGILCSNEKEWDNAFEKMILDSEYRKKIGEQAYEEVRNNHTTINSGYGIAEFIKSKLKKNICFVLPSPNVSGGIMVAIKHALILKNSGYDVTMINANKETGYVDKLFENNEYVNVVKVDRVEFLASIDVLVATMWLTLDFVRSYKNVKKKKYLVQGFETDFYKEDRYERKLANSTYNAVNNIEYLTISKWCHKWLKDKFNVDAKYALNGIDLNLFEYRKRTFDGKIKILIEGNCNDFYKNVDESFKITNQLDRNLYEISYLSYDKEPKNWYKVDKSYNRIPHSEVGKIYAENDILLKTSILESFSYPPLEMMATGGLVVVLPNVGNIEYLKDEENCLMYEKGNIEDAINKIEKLRTNKKISERIIKKGLETARAREWKKIEKDILKLYE